MRASQGAIAALSLALLLAPGSQGATSPIDTGPMDAALREAVMALRASGDGAGQRAHVWRTLQQLTSGKEPAFEGWQGEGALYAAADPAADAPTGMRGFDRPPTAGGDAHGVGAPVVTYTLYSPSAFAHIRRHKMQSLAQLRQVRGAGAKDVAPAFPDDAAILKTAWWPVAAQGLSALPVWDGEAAAPERRGHPYINWPRVVAVDPAASPAPTAAVAFMGTAYPDARRVPVAEFHHITVDAGMAARLARDPESRRAAAIALGRPIAAGDILLLVGANLMTHEQEDWVWTALWWHDGPQAGPFAQGRPEGLPGPWGHYLMSAAFDEVLPREPDGGPHVAFNPWLEARFPDGGQGGGSRSNCMACHARASYPAVPFLPVTRGAPDRSLDPAFAKDRVAARFMWSIPLHAQP